MHDTETNPAPGGRSSSPVGRLRMVMQVTFVVATAVVGFRMAMGWSLTSVEKYCPFGGLEAAYAYFTNQRFICAVGETNLSLFLALLGLTFLARKAFCSWVCPLGAVNEWTWALGRWWRNRPGQTGSGATSWCLEPSPPVDRALRWLRLPVLAVILYFTCKTGELIFRGFDPYYILFSFHGHDVKAWSYAILALVLLSGLLVPMAWCRYLCPLGVALWPLSAVGRLRLARNAESCSGCGACDRACPHSIVVSTGERVRSGECTLCLACVEVCRRDGALDLRLEMMSR